MVLGGNHCGGGGGGRRDGAYKDSRSLRGRRAIRNLVEQYSLRRPNAFRGDLIVSTAGKDLGDAGTKRGGADVEFCS